MSALAVKQLVLDIVDERAEAVIVKHSAVIALTPSWAVKVYDLSEDGERRRSQAVAEHAWLSEHATISVRFFEGAEPARPRFAAIVMERLPDAACVGRQMVERTICARDVERIVKRIDALHATTRPTLIDVRASGDAVCRNVSLQLRVLGQLVPDVVARDVMRHTHAAVSRWQASREAPIIATVIHANAFGPNIFVLPDRCILIDPGLRNEDARRMPWFCEIAPLMADLVLHDLSDLLPAGAFQYDEASRDLLRVAVVTKALVRLRFAVLEQDRASPPSWMDDQNALFRQATLQALERLLDTGLIQ